MSYLQSLPKELRKELANLVAYCPYKLEVWRGGSYRSIFALRFPNYDVGFMLAVVTDMRLARPDIWYFNQAIIDNREAFYNLNDTEYLHHENGVVTLNKRGEVFVVPWCDSLAGKLAVEERRIYSK